MADNSNTDINKVSVKNQSQVYNPSTGNYIIRDTLTGKFIEVKTDGKPYKGVVRENKYLKGIPSSKKEIALKAENAVLNFRNRQILK